MGKTGWSTAFQIAALQDGHISREQLLGLDLSSSAIDRRVANRALLVVHPAVYRIAGAPETWDGRLRAALLASERSSVISCRAAGVEWKLEGLEWDVPEILLRHDEPPLELHAVIVHRTRYLPERDVVSRRGLRLTSPARTLMDLASVLRRLPLERALEDALRRQIVTLDQIQQCLDDRGPSGVKGWGTLNTLVQSNRGMKPTGSWKEKVFFNGLRRRGLPIPEGQYVITNAEGKFVARPDYAYPEIKLAIEVEGNGHLTMSQQERDSDRQNRLIIEGWRPLLFPRTDKEGQRRAFETIESAFAVFGMPEPHIAKSRHPKGG